MCQCGVTFKRWFLIFLFVSLALIIVGIVFIVIGAINYESTTINTKYLDSDRVGAVIDAGGSITSLSVFSYNAKEKRFRLINNKPWKCQDQGIDHYTPENYPTLRQKLSTCLDAPFRSGFIPPNKNVPLFMGASGGMRLLKKRNHTQYDMTLAEVKKTLNASQFRVKYADVITGEREAILDWNAVNSMKEAKDRKGVINFGSSSIQIIFEAQSSTQSPSNFVKVNTTDGVKSLYHNSYLCFGNTEMERRLAAKIVKESGYHNVTDHPCYFKGHSIQYTEDELFQSPCVSGEYAQNVLKESIDRPVNSATKVYTLRGTSNQSACSSSFNDVINQGCTKGSCGMNNVFQPQITGEFVGLSLLFYTARHMEVLNGASLSDYQHKRNEICAKSWDETKQNKYAPRRCFDACYTYYVLTKGFKFPDGSTQISFIHEDSNYMTVQWSLGLIKEKKSEMFIRKGLETTLTIISKSPNYMILLVIGVIFLIAGLILLFCIVKSRRSDRDLVTADDPDEI